MIWEGLYTHSLTTVGSSPGLSGSLQANTMYLKDGSPPMDSPNMFTARGKGMEALFNQADQLRTRLNLRALGTSHPNALLNKVRSLVPEDHRRHECSSCGHMDKLPPCPVAYTQFRTRLPVQTAMRCHQNQRPGDRWPKKLKRAGKPARPWLGHTQFKPSTKLLPSLSL